MDEKWIEIGRIGTFMDSSGRLQTFTQRDLDAIANAYDPKKRDAPLVFGHPQSDSAPAFGWAQKLKSEKGRLFALFAHIPCEVKRLVANKHYRHVSMSLMPDRITLRHVALLGAAQPAIDGLQAVEFENGAEAITIDFAKNHEGVNMDQDELQRQMGQLQAQIEQLKAENAELKQKLEAETSAKDKAESAKTDAEKKAEETVSEFAAYRGKVETEKREARVGALVKDGKIKPADKASILDFAAKLAAQGGTVDFSAPDGKSESISLEERYLRELEARSVDERFIDFSLPPAHADKEAPAWSLNDMASKL